MKRIRIKRFLVLFFIIPLTAIALDAKGALAIQQPDSSPRDGSGDARMISGAVLPRTPRQLPTTIPDNDPEGLFSLQNELLALAEGLIGRRDPATKIFQPAFHADGPRIYNTPALDWAVIQLSPACKTSWSNTLYEMAHETIHLINPVPTYTNWLEEGVAVDFSLYALEQYGIAGHEPRSGPYLEALQMARSLTGGTFSAARRIRAASGSLSAVTFKQMQELFPTCDPSLLQRLITECRPR